ncbi:hypothetical protein Tco_0726933 [Tanacetum coccineum]|uniref:Uncharacterized protein n=1 Tax=Tanacetum coccineum TaxID=301880 RepID=A0ABQ4YJH2_9ASTR
MPVRRIEFTEYAVLFGEQIRRLDCKTQYAVLSRRCDTSYPTGGYGVSAAAVSLSVEQSSSFDNVPATLVLLVTQL